MSTYDDLVATAETAVAEAETLDALGVLQAEFLGKKARINLAKKELGNLDPDRRADAGRALNEARAAIERAFRCRRQALEVDARAAQLESERLDLHRGPDHVASWTCASRHPGA